MPKPDLNESSGQSPDTGRADHKDSHESHHTCHAKLSIQPCSDPKQTNSDLLLWGLAFLPGASGCLLGTPAPLLSHKYLEIPHAPHVCTSSSHPCPLLLLLFPPQPPMPSSCSFHLPPTFVIMMLQIYLEVRCWEGDCEATSYSRIS